VAAQPHCVLHFDLLSPYHFGVCDLRAMCSALGNGKCAAFRFPFHSSKRSAPSPSKPGTQSPSTTSARGAGHLALALQIVGLLGVTVAFVGLTLWLHAYFCPSSPQGGPTAGPAYTPVEMHVSPQTCDDIGSLASQSPEVRHFVRPSQVGKSDCAGGCGAE